MSSVFYSFSETNIIIFTVFAHSLWWCAS